GGWDAVEDWRDDVLERERARDAERIAHAADGLKIAAPLVCLGVDDEEDVETAAHDSGDEEPARRGHLPLREALAAGERHRRPWRDRRQALPRRREAADGDVRLHPAPPRRIVPLRRPVDRP